MFYVLKGFVIEGVQCCLFILILQKSKIVRVYVGVLSFLKVQKIHDHVCYCDGICKKWGFVKVSEKVKKREISGCGA